MTTLPPRRRLLISYAAFYLAFAAVAARAYFTLQPESNFQTMIWVMVVFLALLIAEPWLISRNLVFLHVINALQSGMTLWMLVSVGNFDTFALLLIIPCAQSMLNFPLKTAIIWNGTIGVLVVLAMLDHFPIDEAIGYVIIYPTAILIVSGFCYLALQAEEARNRSEALMGDLQKTHLKLQAYAAQVQELAAAEERNRLARELHDSVTQIIFGLTLSAQAAQLLIKRDTVRASAELDHVQLLAQNALAEMRALIQQLHPRSVAEKGLEISLQQLVEEQQVNHDLAVTLQIKGERTLPANIQEELYRIAKEALNNIVKHAKTNQAKVCIDLQGDGRVVMEIVDDGIGFDPVKARAMPGHLGLTSMSERIGTLGGSLVIDSNPGKGTRLRVELVQVQEVEHV